MHFNSPSGCLDPPIDIRKRKQAGLKGNDLLFGHDSLCQELIRGRKTTSLGCKDKNGMDDRYGAHSLVIT